MKLYITDLIKYIFIFLSIYQLYFSIFLKNFFFSNKKMFTATYSVQGMESYINYHKM